MTHLSLEASKKVYELVGEYETEKHWSRSTKGKVMPWRFGYFSKTMGTEIIPAPTFAELIRVLPKIGEKKGWPVSGARLAGKMVNKLVRMTAIYVGALTEPEGMAAVEEYLMKLL